MKLKAIVRVRNGKPVQIRIKSPTIVGTISIMASEQRKKTAVIEGLGQVEDRQEVTVDVTP